MNKSLFIAAAITILLLMGGMAAYFMNKRSVTTEPIAVSTAQALPEAEPLTGVPQPVDAIAEPQITDPSAADYKIELELKEERIRQAEEAARMARDMAEQERAEREALWHRLNQMLEQEAAARERAEEAARVLQTRMAQIEAELEAARKQQRELADRQKALQEKADAEPTPDVVRQISERARDLEHLALQRERLLQEREERFQRQLELEQEIVRQGGSIMLSGHRRVWSPNYRPFGVGRE